MTSTSDIRKAQALWLLGLLATTELPRVAVEALSQGIESPSLVRLAACYLTASEDIRHLFVSSLSEIGLPHMTKIDALRYYAKEVSAWILQSEVSPLEGARLIWRASLNSGERDFHDLDGFIYAASGLEDRPGDAELFEQAIKDEATRWHDCGG